jgi:hypothetical protein
MKQGWIGVIAGLAIGFTAVYVGQRDEPPAPVRRPSAKAGELVARCTAPLASSYERAAEPLHQQITSAPARALEAARGPVTNVIEIRLGACKQALAVRQADRRAGATGSDVTRDLVTLEECVVKLATARARLDELIASLSSPQASDAPQRLEALDAAMRALPDAMRGSAGSAH